MLRIGKWIVRAQKKLGETSEAGKQSLGRNESAPERERRGREDGWLGEDHFEGIGKGNRLHQKECIVWQKTTGGAQAQQGYPAQGTQQGGN